jgi:tRNA(Ile)-lysidine synthase TilS/MesJ
MSEINIDAQIEAVARCLMRESGIDWEDAGPPSIDFAMRRARIILKPLLDAYEAEHAEVLRLKGLWGAACDLNADLDVEREHAVVESELLRLRANRAERKLQAISDLTTLRAAQCSISFTAAYDLVQDVWDILNPPTALPEDIKG